MKQCLICGSPCRQKYCKNCAKEAYRQNHVNSKGTGKRFSGCDEDCFNCPYPDCRKPVGSFKSDRKGKLSKAIITRDSSPRMYTLELGGYGGPRPNISRKFYV